MLLPFLFSGIWALLMVVLQKFYKNDLEYNSCINSFIHTFANCRGCELVWYIEGSMKLDQFGDDLSMPQYLVVSLSLGYFIYDFIICFFIQENIVYRSPFDMHCHSGVWRTIIQMWTRVNFYSLVLRAYRTIFEYMLLSRAIEIQIIISCDNK